MKYLIMVALCLTACSKQKIYWCSESECSMAPAIFTDKDTCEKAKILSESQLHNVKAICVETAR